MKDDARRIAVNIARLLELRGTATAEPVRRYRFAIPSRKRRF
jgi:hypothetical protein